MNIRKWVYGEGKQSPSYLDGADQSLLTAIAETHAMLIADDLDSEIIISQASNSKTRDDFVAALNSLRESLEN